MDQYKAERGLVEKDDPEVDKPLFRKVGFCGADGIPSMDEMEKRIAAFLRKKREETGLTRADIAPLLGLSTQVYGRYERAFSKMHVTRMIHVCEILGFMPMEMIFNASPSLWGGTMEEAQDRLDLAMLVCTLPSKTTKDLKAMVEHLAEVDHSRAAVKQTKEEESR
ncbi:helix-turn-helix domain-containing protein [Rhizobium rhizogenes]|uniref:helix-turn-helix domain-containing protein n=1 Tax=Rhizobium rhizogenes TaxID=359 RepID=UPI0024BE0FBC|nr:helix-turn-helix transcriptional regulator [Rhizobium rhizogenes]MDJ1638665.1 helix-turn-helix transcriptional regulator [Rhizobium rhizogenes]